MLSTGSKIVMASGKIKISYKLIMYDNLLLQKLDILAKSIYVYCSYVN